MTRLPRADDCETLRCEICTKEIPAEDMHSAEVDNYVVYYCGVECYEKWKEHQDAGTTEEK